ncbi:hypothetical protein PENSPDRAFT_669373 [Peniophora sp. CONT]|nr:hypothetical protein PENSPDRAFT_669373 [Peniophora sp. CONT]
MCNAFEVHVYPPLLRSVSGGREPGPSLAGSYTPDVTWRPRFLPERLHEGYAEMANLYLEPARMNNEAEADGVRQGRRDLLQSQHSEYLRTWEMLQAIAVSLSQDLDELKQSLTFVTLEYKEADRHHKTLVNRCFQSSPLLGEVWSRNGGRFPWEDTEDITECASVAFSALDPKVASARSAVKMLSTGLNAITEDFLQVEERLSSLYREEMPAVEDGMCDLERMMSDDQEVE